MRSGHLEVTGNVIERKALIAGSGKASLFPVLKLHVSSQWTINKKENLVEVKAKDTLKTYFIDPAMRCLATLK